ncbi:hypothetical protein PAXRUDRAFT_823182 [Paxillus rubicundulus Ve08.2h10]|uniref:Uncharacterized protein n=1 Tax=Paxillus rubicundulus Ve08.2h10 TaxID=930991 RepID=A0A0D0DKQ0_9AGAM|nr:hypothetical protein PAXRUDRAFT_823182 [Paxillus rubicundulus Ve08.2h10]
MGRPGVDEYPSVRIYAQRMKAAIMATHDSILEARVKQTRSVSPEASTGGRPDLRVNKGPPPSERTSTQAHPEIHQAVQAPKRLRLIHFCWTYMHA